MRRVLVEEALNGPPGTGYVDGCYVDDVVQVTAESLTLVKVRFPEFCPYHVVHNLLGGHYSQHPQCTAAPFRDVECSHGSHSRPINAQSQRPHCPAMGSVVFLPLGFSYKAGCPGSLVDGCVTCRAFADGMACSACGRRWELGDPMW